MRDYWIRAACATVLVAVAASVALAAAAAAAAASASKVTFVPGATIQELMLTRVDPSADLLWASVSTTITTTGVLEKQPRTPEEWLAVRRLATSLIEAGNLLLVVPRQVAAPGSNTDDANVPGIESPANMQREINANPAQFRSAAAALRRASLKALAAIDHRSPEDLTEAGGELDEACEACHLRYWYPHSPRPP